MYRLLPLVASVIQVYADQLQEVAEVMGLAVVPAQCPRGGAKILPVSLSGDV